MREKYVFKTPAGCAECFVSLYSEPGKTFQDEIEQLADKFAGVVSEFMPVWIKLHLSDIANQSALAQGAFGKFNVPLVLIGQPPANGSRIALEAWCLPQSAVRDEMIRLQNYDLWFFNTPELDGADSFTQMQQEFLEVDRKLARHGGSIEENLHRTWIYCRDVDNNYAGLVQARREFFMHAGLTAQTHYISSTGIEGLSSKFDRLVRMDSLAIFRQQREQVKYLQAPEFLSPTNIYGVTFERGTRVIYGDRSHYYLSGTASIDCRGEIVHPGNVEMQTQRMLDNVEALFESGSASLEDLRQVVVYLRDAADLKTVEAVLEKRLSGQTLCSIVRGAVCRPGWLVELEGIGVNDAGDKRFKDFI